MKAVALLSGGLDSVAAAAMCGSAQGEVVLALGFGYGQKAAGREREASSRVARALGFRRRWIELPWLARITRTSLVGRGAIPLPPAVGKYSGLDDPAGARGRAEAVWVPNRNAVFVNIAAAFAEALGAEAVVGGWNAEEARSFPDNSVEFVRRAGSLLELSTLTGVKVLAPTAGMTKTEIARKIIELGGPLEFVWSCYFGRKMMCGRCEGCLRLLRALEEAGVPPESRPRALPGGRPRGKSRSR